MQRFQAGYLGSIYANGEDDSRAMRPQTIDRRDIDHRQQIKRAKAFLFIRRIKQRRQGERKEEKKKRGREVMKRADGWGEAKRNKCIAAIRVLIMLCSVLKANIYFGYER